MDIEIVRPSDLSREEVAQWAEWQDGCAELSSPFLSAEWPRYIETAQTQEASKVRVVVLHEVGRIHGFLPTTIKGGAASPAGAPFNLAQGLIADRDAEIDARALIAGLPIGRYDFTHVRQSQATFALHMRGLATSWIARLPFGYEIYAADKADEGDTLPRLDERSLVASRTWGEAVFTAVSRSTTDFERLIGWKRDRLREAGQTDVFAASWAQHLLRELFASRDPSFGGALFTLHFGDTLAAAQFHLMGKSAINAWISAENPAFADAAPGEMLLHDTLRWMDDTAYTAFEFGVTEAPALHALANDSREIGHGFVGRPSRAALTRGAAYHLREAAERLPLGRVGAFAGRAMQRFDDRRALR